MPIPTNLTFGMIDMRAILLGILFIGTFNNLAFSQEKDLLELSYVHTSDNTLISGEQLYFSVYVMSEHTRQLTDLSKIGYIQLVGEEGTVVKQKIKLSDGRGAGAIFIGSEIKTGSYFLVFNTRWMRNFDDFSTVALTIINPFEQESQVTTSSDWKAEFKFNHGAPIADIPNTVTLNITNGNGLKKVDPGVLLNNDNSKIVSLKADAMGAFNFEFIPELKKEYQILMEDTLGNFHFFKLPEVTEQQNTLYIKETSDQYLITAKVVTEGFHVIICSPQNTLYKWAVNGNFKTAISKNDIPNGLNIFQLIDAKGNCVAQTTFENITQKEHKVISERVYSTRSKEQESVELQAGTYSIIIRKKWSTIGQTGSSAMRAHRLFFAAKNGDFGNAKTIDGNVNFVKSIGQTFDFLPEHLEEIITGEIIGDDIVDKELYLTLFGENSTISTAISDDQGAFSFHHETPYSDRNAILQLNFSTDNENQKISLESKFVDFQLPSFSEILLSEKQKEEIVQRSVNNQIFKAYETTTDTFIMESLAGQLAFYDMIYALDDYTRFPTLAEHFVEYILGSWVRNGKINIASNFNDKASRNEPLILLDGLMVSSETLLSINPYKIKSIGIVNARVYHQSLIKDGLLHAKTFDSDLGGIDLDSAGTRLQITGWNISRSNVFDPSIHKDSRVPDNRSLLFWEPNFLINQEQEIIIDFYTSDITGDFELEIQGFTSEGTGVSILREFHVDQFSN